MAIVVCLTFYYRHELYTYFHPEPVHGEVIRLPKPSPEDIERLSTDDIIKQGINSYAYKFDTTVKVEKLNIEELGDLSWSKWFTVKKNEFFGLPADTNLILDTKRDIGIYEFENSTFQQSLNWLNRYPSERNLAYFKEHVLPHFMTGKKEFSINDVLTSHLENISGTEYKRVVFDINPQAKGVIHTSFKLKRNIINDYLSGEHPLLAPIPNIVSSPNNIPLPISDQLTGLSINTQRPSIIVEKAESTPSGKSDYFPRTDAEGNIISDPLPDTPTSTSSSLEIHPGTPKPGFLDVYGGESGYKTVEPSLPQFLLQKDFEGKNPYECLSILNHDENDVNYMAFAKFVKEKFDIFPQQFQKLGGKWMYTTDCESTIVERYGLLPPVYQTEEIIPTITGNTRIPTIPDEAYHIRSESLPTKTYIERIRPRATITRPDSTIIDSSVGGLPTTLSEQLGLPLPKSNLVKIDPNLPRTEAVLVESSNVNDMVAPKLSESIPKIGISQDTSFTPGHQVNPSIDVNERFFSNVNTKPSVELAESSKKSWRRIYNAYLDDEEKLLNTNQLHTKELAEVPSTPTTPKSSTTPVATPRAQPRDFPGAFTAETMSEDLDRRSGLHEVTSPILKAFNFRDSLFETTEDSSSTKGGG